MPLCKTTHTSLRILVSDRLSLEHFCKNEHQDWELIHNDERSDELDFDNFDPEVELTNINLRFGLSSIYENIQF